MNILLIHPPFPFNKNQLRAATVLPLGLAVLAGYARSKLKKDNIEILDAHALDLSKEEILHKINSSDFDVVGFSYTSSQASIVYEISDKIKGGTTVIHGGVHATTALEDCIKHAEIVIIGEGEKTFVELIECLRNKEPIRRVKGIAYKKNGKIKKTPHREFIEKLDDVPFPALDLLPMEKYFVQTGENVMHVVGGKRLPIIASRGCPYNCTYCVSPLMWKRRVRWRSPENVIEEVKKWMEEYGVNNFHFWDDNLLINPSWVKEFCETVIKKRIKINWVGLSRASHINRNRKLLKLMKKAGCVGIEIGVESANPETLLKINKGQTISDIALAVKNQEEAGLTPLCTLMAFNPGETIDGYYLQNLFMNKYFNPSPFKRVFLGQFATPYPGTEFFINADKFGVLLTREWAELNHFCISFIPNSLLQDRPRRILKKPSITAYLLTTAAAMMLRHEAFPNGLPKIELLKRAIDHMKVMRFFYKLCDGKQTTMQIAKKISRKFKMDRKGAMRTTVFITLVLALLGLIKSADSTTKVRRIDRSCFFYYLFNAIKLIKTRSHYVY